MNTLYNIINQYRNSIIKSIAFHVFAIIILCISFINFTQQETKTTIQLEPLAVTTTINESEVNKMVAMLQKKEEAKAKEHKKLLKSLAKVKKARIAEEKKLKLSRKRALSLEKKFRKSKKISNSAKKDLEKINRQKLKANKELKAIIKKNKEFSSKVEIAKKTLTELEKKKSPQSKKKSVVKSNATDKTKQLSNDIQKLKMVIISAIKSQWIVKNDDKDRLWCKIQISLSNIGKVLKATIVKSSGDDEFDHRAINAVYKASPLPMADNSELYKHFKTFNFKFKPTVNIG